MEGAKEVRLVTLQSIKYFELVSFECRSEPSAVNTYISV
jgi:hypothetical protein